MLSRESVMAIVRVGQNFDFEECYPKTYQIKPIFPSDIQWSSLIIGNDVSVRSAMGRFPLPETTRFHVLVDAPLNNPLDVHSRERQSNPTYRLEDAIKACALGPVIDQDYCIRRSAVIAYLGKSLINDLIMIILGYDDAEEPFGSSKLQKDPYTIKLWNFSDRKVKF